MSDQAAAPSPDFGEVRDITVIGAGPVGMCTAFWAGMREASSRIIDSLPELGGQLTTLYPEKWIFDVPGHPKVLARDLVEMLHQQALEQFDVPVHLNTTASTISWEGDGEDRLVVLHTDRGELRSRTVVVAGGHGAFEPKKLPGYDMTPWEGRGADYIVGEKSRFAGKRVMIVGGGDSACDWVINLLDTAAEVRLVHRREGFRAHELTVGQVLEAADRGDVMLHVPFQIKEITGNGGVERVRLFHSEDEEHELEVEVDHILLQLGFKTALGPLKEWGFEIEKGAIVVDQLMKTSLERVWACGDITTFAGKLKLIATGFAESAIAVAQAVHEIRPEEKIQPKYSTNTGVPGVVAGQQDGRRLDSPAAIKHLRAADPVLRELIDELGPGGLGDVRRGRPPTDHYGALVRSIVGQQLSTKAARAIYGRLTDRFGGRTPTPVEVLADDPDELRAAAGLSHAKVGFLRSLAEHVLDGSLALDRLNELPDEQVTAELVAVGDLGIRRAVMVRYGLDALPSPVELEALGEPWRPYRTLGCLYLWRSLDAVPV